MFKSYFEPPRLAPYPVHQAASVLTASALAASALAASSLAASALAQVVGPVCWH